jgi:hypothetical protein
MATVGTTSTTLNSGASGYVKLTNTGSVTAVVRCGAERVNLGPGGVTTLTPNGAPVTATTVDAGTTTTVTVESIARDYMIGPTGLVEWEDLSPAVKAELSNTYAGLVDADRVLRRASSILPAPVVASRPLVLSSTITDAGRCCRLQHVLVQAADDLRLVFMNHAIQPAGLGDDQDSAIVPIKVRASIEYPSGTWTVVHFPGEDSSRDVTISPGGRVISDPVPVNIPAGTAFWSNTLVVPVSAGAYPICTATVRPGGPEACNPASATDYTTSTNPGSGVGQFLYGPSAIIGMPTSEATRRSTRTLGVISDSFVAPGTGDAYIGNVDEKGWAARAYSGKIGWLNIAAGGEQLQSCWLSTLAKRHKYRMEMVAACDWVIEGLGTNDFAAGSPPTLATFQANKLDLWARIARRGVKVRAHTIAPRTTSTDAWATTANQTAVASTFGPESGSGSVRQQYNAWLRAGAPTVAGVAVTPGTVGALVAGQAGHPLATACLDLASAIEVYEPSTSTWVWPAGSTADGIHPKQAAHTAIAALESLAVYA